MKKVALITGCTSGIGYELAKQLAIKKYNLFLIDIAGIKLDQLKQEWQEEHKISIQTMNLDLSLDNAAEKIYNEIIKNQIEVEILINNAGIFFFSEVPLTNPENASRLIHLHIHTTSLLCLYISQQMKQRGNGYIMNVSSISAYKDFPGIAFYASSKKYLKGFSRSLRTEMKYYGVSVTALCPGATATNLYDPNVINVKKGLKTGIMMTAEKVARIGLKGMFKKKSVVIPGMLTKIMTFFSILTPHWVIFLLRKKWRKLFE